MILFFRTPSKSVIAVESNHQLTPDEKASGITKFPNLAAMQEEYGKLQAQKEAFYSDYGKLKKKVKEYDVVKQNIDRILRLEKEPERGRETERLQ